MLGVYLKSNQEPIPSGQTSVPLSRISDSIKTYTKEVPVFGTRSLIEVRVLRNSVKTSKKEIV